MSELLKFVSYGGTALLAFMGAYVTVKKSRAHANWWVAAFALVGLLSAAAGMALSNRADNSLSEMLIGGNHYCFYRAELASPNEVTTKSPLWLVCDGPVYNLNVWFSPADAADANDPRYWSLSGQHYPEAIPGGFRSGVALGVGKYRIEMSARNGTVVEILEIKEANGQLAQKLEVLGSPGKKLRSE
jgi:hypothetical protein